ncbi:MAG: formate dehydrogenase accessory protein FdhE [Burkholderiaceae bacterium]|nr:formate dehydrogenase accessory protein FdhE [Burkholderiaceae bacterium]
MSASATVRVMSPEEIAARAGGEVPYLLFPERATLFAERAMRLRQLAGTHPMGDYLRFIAELATVQQQLMGEGAGWAPPAAEALDQAALGGQPPLAASAGAPDARWHTVLRSLVAQVRPKAPAGAAAALQTLADADDVFLDRQADALLQGLHSGLDLACAPVVAAALQVAWTRWVLDTQDAATSAGTAGQALAKAPFGRVDDESRCPCCGSLPVASITRHSGEFAGQRYLSCSLCSTQWQMSRIRCTHCGSTEKLAYQSLATGDDAEGEGSRAAQAAVQAETCDTCHHTLKILHTDRDPLIDVTADDLASLTLDLLVADAGYQRHGQNLMLFFGEAVESPPPDPAADATPPPGRS